MPCFFSYNQLHCELARRNIASSRSGLNRSFLSCLLDLVLPLPLNEFRRRVFGTAATSEALVGPSPLPTGAMLDALVVGLSGSPSACGECGGDPLPPWLELAPCMAAPCSPWLELAALGDLPPGDAGPAGEVPRLLRGDEFLARRWTTPARLSIASSSPEGARPPGEAPPERGAVLGLERPPTAPTAREALRLLAMAGPGLVGPGLVALPLELALPPTSRAVLLPGASGAPL